MTEFRSKNFILIIVIFGALSMSGCGGDGDQDSSALSVAQAGHEEHNHGPDEGHGERAVELNPTVADWCVEHAVPEAECTRCNPSLVVGFKEAGDWCAGHDLPESHCRLCNPEIVFPQEQLIRQRNLERVGSEMTITLNYRENTDVCATDGALIQFASVTTAERTGLRIYPVQVAERVGIYEAPAEIRFDETRTLAITSSVSALVLNWLVSPGDRVENGQALAVIQSPEIAGLRSDLITHRAHFRVEQSQLERHDRLKERDLISQADWDMQSAVTEQARAEYVSARGLLLSAGLSEADIKESLENDNLSNQFFLRAPKAGVIIERIAQMGEFLNAGTTFAIIGNPSAIWIEARLTEQQMHAVDLGSELLFSSDGGGINRVGGKVIWVSQFLDPHTRTGTVRAQIIEPDHRLRAGEFGRVQIVSKGHDDVSLVHRDAVQWEGCCNVVFVKEASDRFRPRKVSLVGKEGQYYQVSSGVLPGEEVVVEGAFLLKTELKKSSIGAGCCGLDPVG